MIAIVGIVIVFATVFGGYLMEGGKLKVLIQPIELLIIGGAATGSLLIASNPTLIQAIIGQLIGAITKGGGTSKQDYTDILLLLFNLFKLAKTNPLAIEPHVETPETSDIFTKYPAFLKNHHAVHFLCDTLKVQVSAGMSPYDLDELMDVDLKSTHEEELKVPTTVNRVGDAMPGLGIVAAVLGVVLTMGKLTLGKEVIGESVAAALVGTFLGILASYGFIQPLAAKMESNIHDEGKVLEVMKVALIAYAKNLSPKVCVEFARRNIPPSVRPTFEEIDKATAGTAK